MLLKFMAFFLSRFDTGHKLLVRSCVFVRLRQMCRVSDDEGYVSCRPCLADGVPGRT